MIDNQEQLRMEAWTLLNLDGKKMSLEMSDTETKAIIQRREGQLGDYIILHFPPGTDSHGISSMLQANVGEDINNKGFLRELISKMNEIKKLISSKHMGGNATDAIDAISEAIEEGLKPKDDQTENKTAKQVLEEAVYEHFKVLLYGLRHQTANPNPNIISDIIDGDINAIKEL